MAGFPLCATARPLVLVGCRALAAEQTQHDTRLDQWKSPAWGGAFSGTPWENRCGGSGVGRVRGGGSPYA
ncbi:protein of unknown function [Cupriavidus neocaledonicus]|uniref:Uncharacterized protein n=1 Tax=Cupriavidus neocaledonicus TaxID=1040979 RepID=A0A375HB46_9BURK|nr:exported hypothetical protein [Cupriavidus neocaledonicus]SPD47467.1 protein of unknown function [Cupriavidus neocaledonicus]